MRELKFRQWQKATHNYTYFALRKGVSLEFNIEPELEQYTGLKDKNGKEIYEGDIVRSWDTNYEVKFCEMQDSDCSYFYQGWGVGDSSLYEEHDFVEIISNIHENPELLEREDAED